MLATMLQDFVCEWEAQVIHQNHQGIVHVTIRLLLFVFYKKSAPFWPDPMGASSHIMSLKRGDAGRDTIE
jgi:hypothetical protein